MDGLLARLARAKVEAIECASLTATERLLIEREMLAFGRELCEELAREADVEAERTTDHESQCTAKIIATRIRKIGKGE